MVKILKGRTGRVDTIRGVGLSGVLAVSLLRIWIT